VTPQTLFAGLLLALALLAGGLALRHFWKVGKPAATTTVIAGSAAGSFFWLWPAMQGQVLAPSVFSTGMFIALALALAAFILPVVAVAFRKK